MYARKGKRKIDKKYDYIEFESEYPLWREKDDSNISGVAHRKFKVAVILLGKPTLSLPPCHHHEDAE